MPYGNVDREDYRHIPMWDVYRDVPISGISLYRDIPRDMGIWGHLMNRDIPIWDVTKDILIWGYPKTGMSLSLLKDIPVNIPYFHWDIPASQFNILRDIPISMTMSSGTSLLYRFFISFNSIRIQLRMLCFRVTSSSHRDTKHTILHWTQVYVLQYSTYS